MCRGTREGEEEEEKGGLVGVVALSCGCVGALYKESSGRTTKVASEKGEARRRSVCVSCQHRVSCCCYCLRQNARRKRQVLGGRREGRGRTGG